MCAVYTVGFISTAEEPATGDEGISAQQVLAFPFKFPLSSLNKRELSRFPRMTLSYCDAGASSSHTTGSSSQPLLIPCTTICLQRCSSQAGRKGAGCPGTGHLIFMTNKGKLRKRGKERIRNLKRVRHQVKIYREIEKMRVKPAPKRAFVLVLQRVDLDAILCSNETQTNLAFQEIRTSQLTPKYKVDMHPIKYLLGNNEVR